MLTSLNRVNEKLDFYLENIYSLLKNDPKLISQMIKWPALIFVHPSIHPFWKVNELTLQFIIVDKLTELF